MANDRGIRLGQIYWVEGIPPLDGDSAKRRPVVVLSPTEMINNDDTSILVVAVTTTPRDPDKIKLPNLAENSETTTSLPEVCWVIPRWYLHRSADKLTDYSGYLKGAKLYAVREVVHGAIEADPDVPHL